MKSISINRIALPILFGTALSACSSDYSSESIDRSRWPVDTPAPRTEKSGLAKFVGGALDVTAVGLAGLVGAAAQNPQMLSGSARPNSFQGTTLNRPSLGPTPLDELRSTLIKQNVDRVNESVAKKDREDRLIQQAQREKKEKMEMRLAYLASDRLGAAYAVNGVIANVYFKAFNITGITESTTTISPASFTMIGRAGWIVIDGTVSGYSRSGQFHTEKFEVMFHKNQESEKPTIVNGNSDFSRGISLVQITGYR